MAGSPWTSREGPRSAQGRHKVSQVEERGGDGVEVMWPRDVLLASQTEGGAMNQRQQVASRGG